MNKIKEGTFETRVLTDETLVMYMKRHPILLLDAFLVRINQQFSMMINLEEKGQKIAVKDINKCFMRCFEALKQLPREHSLEKGSELHRVFAYYHTDVLSSLVS